MAVVVTVEPVKNLLKDVYGREEFIKKVYVSTISVDPPQKKFFCS